MIIKAIEPVAELDLSQVLYFTTQKLVVIEKPLDKRVQENIVIAKYSDGKAYIIHNFGPKAVTANKATKALNNLALYAAEMRPHATIECKPQTED